MRRYLLIVLTFVVGTLLLASYAFPVSLAPVSSLLIDWGIILVAAAGLIGIGYLLWMHFSKILTRAPRAFYSLLVLLAFFFTFIAGMMLTPGDTQFRNWVLSVQVPVETGLLAVLAVTLLYTSLRLIQVRGWTPMSIGFLASTIISLLLNIGLLQFREGSPLAELVGFSRRVPMAGVRGILIGIAIGGLVVGMRTLLALDRPYGD